MTRPRFAAFLVVVALMSPAAGASPAIISPPAGARLETWRTFEVRLSPELHGTQNMCKLMQRLEQGEWRMETHVQAKGATPICVFDLREPAIPLRAGPAQIEAYKGTFSDEPVAVIPVEFVGRTAAGGAGKRFDAQYWVNTGGEGRTGFTIKGATVQDGTIAVAFSIADVSFGEVRAKIDADGAIVPQTVTLAAASKPKKELPELAALALKSTKQVTVSGRFGTATSEGHRLDLYIEGPELPGVDGEYQFSNGNSCKGRLYRRGEQGLSVGWCSRDPGCERQNNCCPSVKRR